MRKVILFIATSIDGYIAGQNNEIDWLFTDADYGFNSFYDSIETTLLGYNTYKVALTFDIFPYPDKKNYVFSLHHTHTDNNPVIFIKENPCEFVKQLKKQEGKNIWLVGGSQINTLLLNDLLIDEIIISIHPIILGKGIPLFTETTTRGNYKLVNSQDFKSGLVQMHYNLR
jgi:dihydrofolate reductase